MSRYINRRTILGIVLILLLGTFVPPLINFGRFRFRVADALGSALGRSVSVGAVHLRLFPRPGLDIEKNFRITGQTGVSDWWSSNFTPFATSEAG